MSVCLSVYLSTCLSIYLSIHRSIDLSLSLSSVYLSICLSVYLSVCLTVYLSIDLSIYLSIYRSIYLSAYLSIYISIYLSIYLSVYLSIYPSIDLSIYLSIYLCIYRSIYLSLSHLSYCLTVYLSIWLSVYLPIYLSISICLSIYLSIYLSLSLICLSVCLSVYLSASLETKLFCETSSVFELDNIKNVAIQRDLTFCIWQHQKRNESARLAHFSKLTTSKTKQFCETSFKIGKLSAELTASYQWVLWFFQGAGRVEKRSGWLRLTTADRLTPADSGWLQLTGWHRLTQGGLDYNCSTCCFWIWIFICSHFPYVIWLQPPSQHQQNDCRVECQIRKKLIRFASFLPRNSCSLPSSGVGQSKSIWSSMRWQFWYQSSLWTVQATLKLQGGWRCWYHLILVDTPSQIEVP